KRSENCLSDRSCFVDPGVALFERTVDLKPVPGIPAQIKFLFNTGSNVLIYRILAGYKRPGRLIGIARPVEVVENKIVYGLILAGHRSSRTVGDCLPIYFRYFQIR